MKSKMMFLVIVAMAAGVFSCSDDNEVKRKGDPDITHEGEKWTITSVEYTLIDQSTSGQTMANDTKPNAGSFYFVSLGSGGVKGSFEMNVEGYNKEDFFNYTYEEPQDEQTPGSVRIFQVEQSAGSTIDQNILTISGEATATEMTVSGTIVKQSTTGQFLLTVDMTLVKD